VFKITESKLKSDIKVEQFIINYTRTEREELLKSLKMGTKEWASRNVNCIKGCGIGCLYCYAKAIAKHYRGYTEESWRTMKLNKKAISKGYGKSKKKTSAPWDIMFPTTHNIFFQEPFYSSCITVLKKCLKAGNNVVITIKPNVKLVKALCKDLLKFKNQIGFRFTIGSVNSDILKLFEPYGSNFNDRLESLKYATSAGFRTTVSAEPLLDFEPYELVEKISPFLSPLDYKRDVGTIWIGLLKKQYIPKELRTGKVGQYLEQLEPKLRFNHVYTYYKKLYDNEKIRWKESILKLMIKNDIKIKII